MVERENISRGSEAERKAMCYTRGRDCGDGNSCRVRYLSRNSKGAIVGKGDMAGRSARCRELKTAPRRRAHPSDTSSGRPHHDIDAYLRHRSSLDTVATTCRQAPPFEVRRLSHPDFLIEVEVMAVIPQS